MNSDAFIDGIIEVLTADDVSDEKAASAVAAIEGMAKSAWPAVAAGNPYARSGNLGSQIPELNPVAPRPDQPRQAAPQAPRQPVRDARTYGNVARSAVSAFPQEFRQASGQRVSQGMAGLQQIGRRLMETHPVAAINRQAVSAMQRPWQPRR